MLQYVTCRSYYTESTAEHSNRVPRDDRRRIQSNTPKTKRRMHDTNVHNDTAIKQMTAADKSQECVTQPACPENGELRQLLVETTVVCGLTRRMY